MTCKRIVLRPSSDNVDIRPIKRKKWNFQGYQKNHVEFPIGLSFWS